MSWTNLDNDDKNNTRYLCRISLGKIFMEDLYETKCITNEKRKKSVYADTLSHVWGMGVRFGYGEGNHSPEMPEVSS